MPAPPLGRVKGAKFIWGSSLWVRSHEQAKRGGAADLHQRFEWGSISRTDQSTAHPGVVQPALELVDLCAQPWRLQAGDIVILASDGVETLAGDELLAVLKNPGDRSLQELAGDLMASIEAIGHSSQDNASVILYRPGTDQAS